MYVGDPNKNTVYAYTRNPTTNFYGLAGSTTQPTLLNFGVSVCALPETSNMIATASDDGGLYNIVTYVAENSS